MKKKIHFIVNPISGRHNKETFPDKVSKLINKELFDYYITFTEHPGHGEELAKKSVVVGRCETPEFLYAERGFGFYWTT